jgi:hypothetical protein
MLTNSRFEKFEQGKLNSGFSDLPFAESKSRRGNSTAYYKPHFTENNFVKIDLHTPESKVDSRKTRNPLV